MALKMNQVFKSTVLGSVLALCMGFSASAMADIVVVGSNGGTLTGVTTASPAVAAPGAGTIFFNWSFHTNDVDGAALDPAGYYLDIPTNIFQITNDVGPVDQSGSSSFAVASGQLYGFYVFATDDQLGEATLTVIGNPTFVPTNPNAVPEPGSIALLGLGLLGLAAVRKRKQV